MSDRARYAWVLLTRGGAWFFGGIGAITWVLERFGVLDVPSFVYWLVALAALFAGGYQEYEDEAALRQSAEATIETLIRQADRPHVEVMLYPGSEYSFELAASESGDTPRAVVEATVRITNQGPAEVQLISVSAEEFDEEATPWKVRFPPDERPRKRDGSPLGEPVALPVGDPLVVTLRGEAGCSDRLNAAQFARSLADLNAHPAQLRIKVHVVDASNRDLHFGEVTTIEPAQLADLYVQKWRDEGREQLLDLVKTSSSELDRGC